MQRLIEGHKRFLAEVFPAHRSQFQLLAETQAPEWLFITCSDSRVLPDLFLGTGPRRPVHHPQRRQRGACHQQDVDGVTATIEYAVEVLRVKEAILCGHSDCGALKAFLHPNTLDGMPKARRWLHHIDEAFQHRQPLNPAEGESAELASLIRGNVVAQLLNLKAQPSVARAMDAGRLTVHGWYYEILSGHIERYDEGMGRFLPVVD
jgi:carbonic anhydrase